MPSLAVTIATLYGSPSLKCGDAFFWATAILGTKQHPWWFLTHKRTSVHKRISVFWVSGVPMDTPIFGLQPNGSKMAGPKDKFVSGLNLRIFHTSSDWFSWTITWEWKRCSSPIKSPICSFQKTQQFMELDTVQGLLFLPAPSKHHKK